MDSSKGITHEDIYSMKNSRYDVFYKVLFHLQICILTLQYWDLRLNTGQNEVIKQNGMT